MLAACGVQSSDAPARPARVVAPGVTQVGVIQHPRLTESSGVVAGRRDTNILWTHSDGGGRKQILYAMSRSGAPLAEFHVAGALVHDWEDIAADGQGHLYIGDLGNNDNRRTQLAVHRIDEPDLATNRMGFATVNRSWFLEFPGARFDCESLFILRDHGYVISKVFDDARAELYRFALTNGAAQKLELVARLKIDSPVTGADISPDGALLGVVAKNGAYVFRIDGDPARAGRGKPYHTKFRHEHIEACTFVPEGLLATAESREIFLFTDPPFRGGAKP
jgi:hypothetical protein